MGEDHIDEIYSALAQALSSNADVSVKLLPEDQLLVSSHLITNPASASTFKTAQLVPAANGYTIHVRITPAGAEALPQQRPIHPAEFVSLNDVTLKLDRDSLDQSWQILSPDDEQISIAVHCGSESVFDEVDRLLDLTDRALRAGPR